jgi:hypothetical protein
VQDQRVFKQTLAVSLLLLAGCESMPDIGSEIGPDIGSHRLGETFTVPVGKHEIIKEAMMLAVREVVEDSRCPKQVTCVWQGAARVRVDVIAGTDPKTSPRQDIELSTAPANASSTTIGGFRIELLDASPYPETATPLDRDHYRFTLRVSRAP